MIGTKFAHYEITAHLGSGGMGAVYQATDLKLRRNVALKLLPDTFASDPDRLARFRREAQMLALLNHPNVAQIFGIEESGQTCCIVMEFVDGESLLARIKRGPVPLEEAVTIAKQIAEALDAAHEKGIVHRDLKPGNIMLTSGGSVKVLDFGLAKAYEESPSNASVSHSPTMASMAATVAGVILGTAAYMAPEQAKGKPVDKRADIWAFGVVLYEMLTGKTLFAGETVTETLAAVIEREPDWKSVSAKAQPLLRRCLVKDPKRRLRDIGDAMAWIENAQEFTPASIAPAPRSRTSRLWPAVAGILALALAATAWNAWRVPSPAEPPLVRQDVDLGSDISLPAPVTFASNIAISPDGTRLAYVASVSGGPVRLLTRRLDQPKATELSGTDGAQRPFFSKDGQWLGFNSGRKLNKISVNGGAVVQLMDLVGTFGGAAWADDGIIVAQQGNPLGKVPEGGGQATPVVELLKGEIIQSSPQLLPEGKAVLFASNIGTDPDKATIDVLTLANHQRKTLVRGGAFPRFTAPPNGKKGNGYLLYIFKNALYAISFDPDKLETHGTPIPVLDDLIGGLAGIPGKFEVSQTGTLVYQKSTGAAATLSTIQWLDSAGKPEPLLTRQGAYWHPRVSPDGKRIAFRFAETVNRDIQVYEWQNDRSTRLTFGGRTYDFPVWTPDGQFVVFYSDSGGMFWARADGSGQPQRLTDGTTLQAPWSFSSDGKWMAFVANPSGTQIYTLPLEVQGGQLKAGQPQQYLKDSFNYTSPSLSPDGKWMAYASTEAGPTPEVYVRPFPLPPSGQGGKWVISNQGGQNPIWSRTGHDLLYQAPSGQIMAASYTLKGDVFVADKPRVWLSRPLATDYDLSPDGKRLAVVTPVGTEQAPKPDHVVVFLQNFFDELWRRVPAGN